MSTTQTTTSSAAAPQTQSHSAPTPQSTDHLDGISYLFGHPIAHSLSPLLHQTIYDSLSLKNSQHLYETLSLPSCLALTTQPKFYGASVTMPFKVAIIPHLDELTPEGIAIGAINTIFLRPSPTEPGKRLLCGTNTDCIGIREAVLQNIDAVTAASFKGRPGVVIGGGGTSRAAVYALKHFLGCGEVYLVNRDEGEVSAVIAECTAQGFGDGLQYVSTLSQAEALPFAPVIISAIPDFPPKTEKEIETRKVVECLLSKGKGTILEMCYHPSPETAIAGLAEKAGWKLIGGSEAMIWQGLEQDRVWLGKEVKELPVERVKEVIKARLEVERKARGH